MQVSRFLKVLVVLSALMLLVPVAAAADPGIAKERPFKFKVEFSGPFEIVYPASWCSAETVGVMMTFTGGHGAHLGRLAGMAKHCTNMTTGEITNGAGYFEAANGDRLNAKYDGWGAPTADPSVWDISCDHEYAEGTGRFANADGDALGVTKAFFLGADYGLVEGTLVGTIAYDASDRRK